MAAYVIVDIDVHDEPGLAEYRKLVPATVEKYGGRFAVRGGKFETREGTWQPKRAAAGHAPQGVQGQPGDRRRRVVAARYFLSNIRLISVSAHAMASLGLEALVTTLATMLGMM